MNTNPLQGLFITGTDTGVGKTVIGTALVSCFHNAGIDVQPRKPVESGCRTQNGMLMPEDGLGYHRAVRQTVALETITPYRYSAALAPPRAARLENQSISLEQLEQAARRGLEPESYCVIEGAGGFYSPLAEDGLNADLAQALRWPVLLVAADRLGCINHVLLTLEAIENRGLFCAAVVLNACAQMPAGDEMDNKTELSRLISVPVITTGFTDRGAPDMGALAKLVSDM